MEILIRPLFLFQVNPMQNKVWVYLNVLSSWWRLLVYGLYCTCKPTESSYLFQCQIPNNKIPLLYGWVHFPHIHLKTTTFMNLFFPLITITFSHLYCGYQNVTYDILFKF